MKVTAIVEFPGWDEDSAESAIVKEAATKILKVAQDDIILKAREAVMAEIKAQVGVIIQTVIAEPVRRTNTYGEPIGDPVTLRELIFVAAQDWLGEGVDPKDGRPSRSYRDGTVPRAHYYIRTIVRQEMEETYKGAIDAAVQEAKGEMGDKVTEMVREAIARILKV